MFLVKIVEKRKQRNSKINKVVDKAVSGKRLIIAMAFILVLFVALIIRIMWIQFVEGSELKELASRQQTLNRIISPKRGTIYDANGKALAISAEVDTITVNPSKFIIKNKPGETLALQEKVAKGLAEIFSLDYETVLSQVQSTNSVETIIKKVEKEYVDKLKKWMEENEIKTGINIDADNKRYYPYGSMAAHVIGFTGTDSQGLYGIESKWDSTLKGTSGKIVTTKDVSGDVISGEAQQYVEVENGSDLYLTIDVEIQRTVEKYLEQGVKDNEALAGSAIVMDPAPGDILAMATYPTYDLNDPYTVTTMSKEEYDVLSDEEKRNAMYEMWADRNFSKTYEPGSTFKLVVAAAALEEDITEPEIANDFQCKRIYRSCR